jgi:hypothetical protein
MLWSHFCIIPIAVFCVEMTIFRIFLTKTFLKSYHRAQLTKISHQVVFFSSFMSISQQHNFRKGKIENLYLQHWSPRGHLFKLRLSTFQNSPQPAASVISRGSRESMSIDVVDEFVADEMAASTARSSSSASSRCPFYALRQESFLANFYSNFFEGVMPLCTSLSLQRNATYILHM